MIVSEKPRIELIRGDCRPALKKMKAGQFDMAIVDPAWGIGSDRPHRKKSRVKQKNGSYLPVRGFEHTDRDWDRGPAGKEYFDEIFRVSRHQIIWGVNYFDYPFRGGRIIWDKMNDGSNQLDAEIAYNSQSNRIDLVRYKWRGMIKGEMISNDFHQAKKQQGDKSKNEKRSHPSFKPVKLYTYQLVKWAKPGWDILDTHGGSMTLARACWDVGCNLVAYEIDEGYYNRAVEGFFAHIKQYDAFKGAGQVTHKINFGQ